MNCEKFRESSTDLLPGEMLAEMQQHALACASCSNWVSEQKAAFELLRLVAAESREIQPPVHLKKKLADAFRSHHRRKRIRVWAAAAAAVLVVFGGTLFLTHRQSAVIRPLSAEKIAVSSLPARIPKNGSQGFAEFAAAGSHPRPKPQATAKKNHKRKAQPPAVVNSAPEENLATQFFPLPYGDSSAPVEGAQIIRIRVPRSALLSVGLPMNPDNASGEVDAEVVLNDQMVARAIRFIH